MTVDENDFFRQATLRICSSLEIEIAIKRSLQYLEKFMPVSEMYLNLFEPDLGVIRGLAAVTTTGSKKPFPPTPLSKEAIRKIESGISEWHEVRIIKTPELNPIAIKLFSNYDLSNLSYMIMVLVIEEKTLGALGIIAEGRQRFTKTHADLISLLRDPFAIAMSNAVRYQEILNLKDMLDAENRELHQELSYISGDEIIGAEFGLKRVMEMVGQVAPIDSPVMLMGETGTGKEVIANAIHYLSSRKDGSFIKINCGAIPDNLVDSELFGHEKGAFTGAIAQKRGRFERADKGSIFLDEIGDLPLQAQVRLLRVLQNKEIERVGGTHPIPVDVRIITATHRNLEEMIGSGQFREDLWYRLNTFPIMIPPLRHRKEDIPALVHHFIERKSKELKIHTRPAIAAGIIERFKTYHWPGNVRELENLVERVLIQSMGRKGNDPLGFEHFASSEIEDSLQSVSDQQQDFLPLDEAMSIHIQRALHLRNWKIFGKDGAAQLLGINPNTLRSKMKKLGIPFGKHNKS
ncbi:MAG: sigma 54-interacting transcriptional regulator [Desulfobacterales bacterium]|jgi:transcriptional regulator with GAF, ATPase, and Fis domain